MKIFGVGPKVADCALLYGFTVWNAARWTSGWKRVFHLYQTELPSCPKITSAFAQQYLFHYAHVPVGCLSC